LTGFAESGTIQESTKNLFHDSRKPTMSEIPTRVTEQQFARFFDPYLSQAARGFVGRIPRYKLFNYILYWLHTGCQWDEIPIEQQSGSEKKKSVTTLFTLSSRNGAMTAV
jgi:hypothetical protein